MPWDHVKKQMELALIAINRPRPYRPLKLVPHDPMRNPRLVTAIKGWITEAYCVVPGRPKYGIVPRLSRRRGL